MFGSKGGKASKGRPDMPCPPGLCQWGISAGWANAGRATAMRVVKNICGDWHETVLRKKMPLLMMVEWHMVDWKGKARFGLRWRILWRSLVSSGPTGFSFKMTYHKRKISSPYCFLFPPLVANQDSILMTSLYSLGFLSPCPTHAFFIFIFFLCISFWQELKHKKHLDQDETSGGACWAVQCFVLSSGGEEGEVRGTGCHFPDGDPAKDVLASESKERFLRLYQV